MKELAIILVILIAGYGVLGMYFWHECRKSKYIEKDIGRDEADG